MSDETPPPDLDAIERRHRRSLDFDAPHPPPEFWEDVPGLVAEVRRLRLELEAERAVSAALRADISRLCAMLTPGHGIA